MSIDAAAAMHRRLAGLCRPLAPEPFLALDDATLRRCGFSRQKMGYARGLAAGGRQRQARFRPACGCRDDEALATLVALKGIGRWSAEIYLIFALGRPDIWPAADLGLQLAVAECLGLAERPARDGAARDRRAVAAVALGRRLPVLAILSARPRPQPRRFSRRSFMRMRSDKPAAAKSWLMRGMRISPLYCQGGIGMRPPWNGRARQSRLRHCARMRRVLPARARRSGGPGSAGLRRSGDRASAERSRSSEACRHARASGAYRTGKRDPPAALAQWKLRSRSSSPIRCR